MINWKHVFIPCGAQSTCILCRGLQWFWVAQGCVAVLIMLAWLWENW